MTRLLEMSGQLERPHLRQIEEDVLGLNPLLLHASPHLLPAAAAGLALVPVPLDNSVLVKARRPWRHLDDARRLGVLLWVVILGQVRHQRRPLAVWTVEKSRSSVRLHEKDVGATEALGR